MNRPGVSFSAVARPIPTPHQARPRRRATTSARTSAKMNMFSWPSPSVSRIGSSARTAGTARATANHGEIPCRRATGATSHQVTSTTTAAEASRTRIAAGPAGSQVSGTRRAAAKGG